MIRLGSGALGNKRINRLRLGETGVQRLDYISRVKIHAAFMNARVN